MTIDFNTFVPSWVRDFTGTAEEVNDTAYFYLREINSIFTAYYTTDEYVHLSLSDRCDITGLHNGFLDFIYKSTYLGIGKQVELIIPIEFSEYLQNPSEVFDYIKRFDSVIHSYLTEDNGLDRGYIKEHVVPVKNVFTEILIWIHEKGKVNLIEQAFLAEQQQILNDYAANEQQKNDQKEALDDTLVRVVAAQKARFEKEFNEGKITFEQYENALKSTEENAAAVANESGLNS